MARRSRATRRRALGPHVRPPPSQRDRRRCDRHSRVRATCSIPRRRLDVEEIEELARPARVAGPDAALALYERALALWRGRAFGPFGDEWWALGRGTRLDELRAIVAGEERAAALIATGTRARAVPELQASSSNIRCVSVPCACSRRPCRRPGATPKRSANSPRSALRLADQSGLDPSPDVIELERVARDRRSQGRLLQRAAGRSRGYVIHDADRRRRIRACVRRDATRH